ncbi:hypothetical protein B0T22DRAFT_368303 [Podospora appendiculata]|uniref:RRM domain-containing protein n=1 Tax=Podospora appendiculata TaxID=314037 RepID=A0AAE0XHN5_9PEZI|nr:hypothetical protein B0T22DRAFT_368303 [Podospora appendiculata]
MNGNGDRNPTGASSGASSGALTNGNGSFASLSSNRGTPFSASTPATNNAMAAQAFSTQAPSFRPSVSSKPSYGHSAAPLNGSPYDRDATKPVATSTSAALLRKLPINVGEDTVRLITLFSKSLSKTDILPVDQSPDEGFQSVVLKFDSPTGAEEAKANLDGRPNPDASANMMVELLGSSPTNLGKRYPLDTPSTATSSATSSTGSSSTSRQPSRFNGNFQSLDTMSPTMNNVYGSELTSPESNGHYQNLFSPQSPIGNHLTDRSRVSGKALINNDSADDDETGELLKDPVGFAENGLQRRQTAPQIPIISRMAGLSLNTTPTTAAMPSLYGHHSMGPFSAHPAAPTPTAIGASGSGMGFNQQQPFRAHNFPPANPADQNPPCNTLYVGNLPIDTSEEELKAMFSKQRGYKRLCFRTKQNGPMCFVEFEDVTFATKALHELYGQPLHNSVKGGIRLSFSKNPLGVRSGQTPGGQNTAPSVPGINGIHTASNNGFTTASGPPPGLSAPPGLGINRSGYSGSPNLESSRGNNTYMSTAYPVASNNPWGLYNGHHASVMAGSSATYPPHMMGR